MKTIFKNQEAYRTWHDRLGHPGLRMMQNIVKNANGHNLKTKEFPNQDDFLCLACAELSSFLERIQGDICGPITP